MKSELEQKKEHIVNVETWIVDAEANVRRTTADIEIEKKALAGLKAEVAEMEKTAQPIAESPDGQQV